MQVVFHIGLHKTGSTYLQQYIFPMLCLNENYLAKGAAQRALREHDLSADRLNFLSEESWSNSIKNPSQGWRAFEEFFSAARAIKSMSKKIIIVLRRHEDYLWSSYLHELKMGRQRSVSLQDYAYSFGEKGLNFFSRVERLSTHFQVLVLDYQQLKSSPDAFVKRIAEFSGISSYSKEMFAVIPKPYNLTPTTAASMLASQSFEIMYQAINSPIKAIARKSILSERNRIQTRDCAIAAAQKYLPPRLRKPLQRPELPEDLRAIFSRDWEKCAPRLYGI